MAKRGIKEYENYDGRVANISPNSLLPWGEQFRAWSGRASGQGGSLVVLRPGRIVHKRDGGRVTSGSWNPTGARQQQEKQGQERDQRKEQNQEKEQEQDYEKQQVLEQDDLNMNERFLIPHQWFML